ncbi:TPA: hypothetical protein DCX16_04435 [bacterium]|nr:hypothetical protein [bacterium]
MQGRILLADNDPSVLEALKNRTEKEGYIVFTAKSPDEAKELLKKERIHLAIIDMRLIDHGDMKDISGIELAKEIDPLIIKIILTGFPSHETQRMATSDSFGGIAYDYISKPDDPPSALIESIKKAFDDKIKINFELKIILKDDKPSGTFVYLEDEKAFEFLLDEISIKGIEAEEEKKKIEEELGEVFKKLFYLAEKITILPLSSRGYSKTGVVLVEPSQDDEGTFAPRIVKFGPRKDIERESQNYKNHVKPFVQLRPTEAEEPAYTKNLGGMIYTLVGSRNPETICDFREYYSNKEAEDLRITLKELFEETCERWYQNRGNKVDMELGELYKEQIGLTQKKLEKALKDTFQNYMGKTLINFPGLEKDFINPVIWLKDKVFHFSTYRCRTHGDLNGKNILVDEDGHPWLIDFFRTGYGHILRDFVELEVDIKFNYLETSNIKALYEFEKSLISPKKFDEPYYFENKNNISELEKVFAVIKSLRNLAHDVVKPSNDLLEYYIGLLYHTINIIRYDKAKDVKRHALLSASLICERLEKWDQ